MEKNYFIVQQGEQKGPFTLEQLKTMPLTRETKIWYQGLDGWKMIAEIPELSELEAMLPPPVGNDQWQPLSSPNAAMSDPPKSYLTEAILVTLFCCWPLGIPAIVNASKVESKFNKGDFEGAEEASRKAKEYMQYSFWSGLIIVVLYFFFIILSGGRTGRF
jgi:hypothetical protein